MQLECEGKDPFSRCWNKGRPERPMEIAFETPCAVTILTRAVILHYANHFLTRKAYKSSGGLHICRVKGLAPIQSKHGNCCPVHNTIICNDLHEVEP